MRISQCTFCSRLNSEDWSCAAFPDGIPAAIANSEVSHFEPYPGDRGLQFEPATDVTEGEIEMLRASIGSMPPGVIA